MEPNRNIVSTDVMAAVFESMYDVGQEILEAVQQTIDAKYPPASKPGEPPRKRSGNLKAMTAAETVVDGATVRLTLSNDAFYAVYLRDGTRTMGARDFFGENWIDVFTPHVVDAACDGITSKVGGSR